MVNADFHVFFRKNNEISGLVGVAGCYYPAVFCKYFLLLYFSLEEPIICVIFFA